MLAPYTSYAGVAPYQYSTAAPRFKILEILLVGGLSHADTIWIQHHTKPSRWERSNQVSYGSFHASDPYGMDLSGTDRYYQVSDYVYMSRVCRPLLNSQLWSRLRVVALRHNLDPHDPARVLSLTGQGIGRPGRVSLGAAVQSLRGGTGDPLPHAYVLNPYPGGLGNEAAFYGTLGAPARPMVLPVTPNAGDFVLRLDRSRFSDTDPLLVEYGAQYGLRLTRTDANSSTTYRSGAWLGWAGATDRLDTTDNLKASLQNGSPNWLRPDPSAQAGTYAASRTRQAILAAAHLLKPGTGQADAGHVCVLDHGAAGGYDTHNTQLPGVDTAARHAEIHGKNLYTVFAALREALDAGDLDLSTTLVHIHTDFGRAYDGATGSNHWPRGYVNLLIGGPIPLPSDPALQKPALKGTLEVQNAADRTGGVAARPGTGSTQLALNPSDLRAATMLAAGIDPFDPSATLIPLTDLSATYATNQAAIADLRTLFT